MKRIFFSVITSYLIMYTISFGQVGQSGLTFLKFGVGGRAVGMGEAYTAIAHDPSAAFYNPSLLPNSTDMQILIMHKEWIQDTKIDYMSAVTSMKNFSFGLSINSTSINDIPIRTQPGPEIGKFDAHNAAIGFSSAYSISSDFSMGLTFKYIYEKIYINEASGYAFDFGGWYRTPWDIQLGASINNLGSMNALRDEASKLPTLIRFGGGYQIPMTDIDATINIASDFVSYIEEKKSHLHLGTEFDYKHTVAFRLGYQTGYDSKSFSTGFGIQYNIFRFDYAFVPFTNDFGSTHTFSLLIDFN